MPKIRLARGRSAHPFRESPTRQIENFETRNHQSAGHRRASANGKRTPRRCLSLSHPANIVNESRLFIENWRSQILRNAKTFFGNGLPAWDSNLFFFTPPCPPRGFLRSSS